MQNENLKIGEIVCRLNEEETNKLKRISVAIESLDQTVDRLLRRRELLCEMRTDWWEKIYNSYLLTRGCNYHINFETYELMKL